MLQDKDAFKFCIDSLYDLVKNKKYDKVVAIESRGFIFASALALKLNAGFVILRKPGKLPYKTIQESYDLEYGKNVLEMHIDALKKNEKILLVDDLLATGGTISAAINLVEKSNAKVEDILFVIELEFLKGREKLKNYNVKSLIKY